MRNYEAIPAQTAIDSSTEPAECKHCGNICPSQEDEFCCSGCESVYQFINSVDLADYYKFKDKKGLRAESKKEKFFDFDHADLREKYIRHYKDKIELKLFIEGIHCTACLWILEKLPQINNRIFYTQLNMTDSVLKLHLHPEAQLSDILGLISDLGYKPHPIKTNEDQSSLVLKEKRSAITKLGVSAAVTGNIMLMTTSLYGGADGIDAQLFHWISFGLALIIVFYTSAEFYTNSLRSLKQRTFSVDYSLAIAVLFGFSISTYNLIIGDDAIYFDSIAGLSFLILSSRYFLKYATWKNLGNGKEQNPLSPRLVCIVENGVEKSILPENIKPGSTIKVETGKRIPVDSKLISEEATIDESVVTGENLAQKKNSNDIILGGTRNLGKAIYLVSTKTQNESYIFEVLEEAKSLEKSENMEQANRYAKVLSLVSHSFALFAIVYFGLTQSFNEGFNIALSILIISCPCAFAIATPLSIRKAYDQLVSWGVVVKNLYSIEKLASVKNVFFDKTGTLTYPEFQIEKLVQLDEQFSKKEILNILGQLEKYSKHPLAASIRSYVTENSPYWKDEQNYIPQETLGRGVKLVYKNINFSIEGAEKPQDTQKILVLKRENQAIAEIYFKNMIRPESAHVLNELNKSLTVHILSGDKDPQVSRFCKEVHFDGAKYSEKTPKEKAEILSRFNDTLMIGDGVNDSLAFKKANVGVATQGSVEVAFKSSDLYLDAAQISLIPSMIKLSKKLKNSIKTNYRISIVFNSFFISLALLGKINPLVAAVIMPASSFLLSLKSLYVMRLQNKEEA